MRVHKCLRWRWVPEPRREFKWRLREARRFIWPTPGENLSLLCAWWPAPPNCNKTTSEPASCEARCRRRLHGSPRDPKHVPARRLIEFGRAPCMKLAHDVFGDKLCKRACQRISKQIGAFDERANAGFVATRLGFISLQCSKSASPRQRLIKLIQRARIPAGNKGCSCKWSN